MLPCYCLAPTAQLPQMLPATNCPTASSTAGPTASSTAIDCHQLPTANCQVAARHQLPNCQQYRFTAWHQLPTAKLRHRLCQLPTDKLLLVAQLPTVNCQLPTAQLPSNSHALQGVLLNTASMVDNQDVVQKYHGSHVPWSELAGRSCRSWHGRWVKRST